MVSVSGSECRPPRQPYQAAPDRALRQRDTGLKGDAMSDNSNTGAASGGALYGLGMLGAWVWFWQQADGFWEYVLAILEGLIWPAFMVYQVFAALNAG